MGKYDKIREDIKKLSQQQVELKPQRKTVHLKVKRTSDPVWATNVVSMNKNDLMHLYHAYAKLKGFDLPKPTKKFLNENIVNKLVDKYQVLV